MIRHWAWTKFPTQQFHFQSESSLVIKSISNLLLMFILSKNEIIRSIVHKNTCLFPSNFSIHQAYLNHMKLISCDIRSSDLNVQEYFFCQTSTKNCSHPTFPHSQRLSKLNWSIEDWSIIIISSRSKSGSKGSGEKGNSPNNRKFWDDYVKNFFSISQSFPPSENIWSQPIYRNFYPDKH